MVHNSILQILDLRNISGMMPNTRGKIDKSDFKVVRFKDDSTEAEKKMRHNVADAFEDINSNMVNIKTHIDKMSNHIDSDILHCNNKNKAY
ncbi:hypothetical protein NPX99_08050 [Bartonella sp. 220]|uniref:hypothetical protein n=1 Tax=Bartonella sp. 220B TaxID=2967260 RepID=UPI0022A91B9F|nr:hypothetical protein [Bartonella sp. 220B]MCZ2159195.1 hypothetical protein [Bartonella sp. 220B]